MRAELTGDRDRAPAENADVSWCGSSIWAGSTVVGSSPFKYVCSILLMENLVGTHFHQPEKDIGC